MRDFTEFEVKPIDALHLASAEALEADFFCTCDDNFLKKAREIDDIGIKAVSILELLQELENGNYGSNDPFDRMLICQAVENGLTILTPDQHIQRYPVKTLW